LNTPSTASPAPSAAANAPADAALGSFPIVAIGASAGGLDALEKFIAPVPADAPQAFVVIQHMDPTHRPMLVELLQRHSNLPVAEATDGTVVEPGHVYVIPADRELSILNGVLLVLEPSKPRGHRLPIDVFMTALADDRGANAIAVVLSGMGLDGSAGLRAVKQQGGGTFAQSPDTSQFDSMPRHAIAANIVDVVAAPDALYAEIAKRPIAAVPSTWEGLDKVIRLVRTRTGHDFSQYKRSTLTRRIARRMQTHHLDSLDAYLHILRSDSSEADALFNMLLIGVTRFFRDPQAWEEMSRTAIPALIAAHTSGDTIRAWVPGCSTGEEAYSLAILFREALAELGNATHISIQIFATDLDRQAVAKARAALYPPSIANDVSPERLRRFFVQDNDGFRLIKSIRESVILAPQNVVMDPPFTKLDLISCRNLLIYLTPELQHRVLQLFHYGLRPQGLLFLGSAETAGPQSPYFTPLVDSARIYRRADTAVAFEDLDFSRGFERVPSGDRNAGRSSDGNNQLRATMEEMVLQRFAPTAMLVTADGTPLQALGDLPRFFGPAVTQASALQLAAARTPLTKAILGGLATALAEQRTIVLDDVDEPLGAGTMRVRIAIAPMQAGTAPEGSCLVVLNEVTPESGASALPAAEPSGRMARELEALWRKLEVARQETMASQQELSASNEELQSANEELTSSKEEMQSMNEELQTVNHELQAKLDELTLASNDMTNLLNSTSIATLFLDADLNVRRFTTPTTRIIRLIPGDIGRPITDLVSALDFPDMVAVAKDVLRTLVVFERTVPASGGRWFNVRIMPYRTQDDHIDGLVLTFTDATQAKTLEAALRAAHTKLEAKLATRDDDSTAPRPPGDSS
jgi:two-component system CheB/CheR fusion protein